MNSIFSLSRIKDEPYLTQVFSFLLDSDRQFCNFLLENIFDLKNTGEVLQIIPEATTESGRPDIVIECEKTRIAIEDKIGADFVGDQIKKYKRECQYVFLIYKYLTDPNQAKDATKYFTWHKIYSETKEYIESLPNNYGIIDRYLLEQFLQFLEETGMAMERVGWEIVNGAKSLLNLFAQITEAFERLKSMGQITDYSSWSATSSYNGWQVTIGNDALYVYVCYFPLFVFSYFFDKEDRSLEYKRVSEVHPELAFWERNSWHLGTLDIKETNFLCLTADKQIDAIVEFTKLSKQKYLGEDGVSP